MILEWGSCGKLWSSFWTSCNAFLRYWTSITSDKRHRQFPVRTHNNKFHRKSLSRFWVKLENERTSKSSHLYVHFKRECMKTNWLCFDHLGRVHAQLYITSLRLCSGTVAQGRRGGNSREGRGFCLSSVGYSTTLAVSRPYSGKSLFSVMGSHFGARNFGIIGHRKRSDGRKFAE
jgi:hypothetical protein